MNLNYPYSGIEGMEFVPESETENFVTFAHDGGKVPLWPPLPPEGHALPWMTNGNHYAI
ncbi:MAG: hypothetical protein QM523_00575 [Candidatus Pacebacteria bacterium]|nr:hypothetical protein [Candidatus Paceibacterota bacterium]